MDGARDLLQLVNELLNYPLIVHKEFRLTSLNILLFVVFLVAARFISRFVRKLILRRMMASHEAHKGNVFAIAQIAGYIVYLAVVLLALNAIGIDMTFVLAGSTALFVGIGFGLQHTFNDFASGIILLFEGGLHIDDVVEVDGMVGKVHAIGLRTSKIYTREGYSIIVPNSRFVVNSVVNWSHQALETRFKVEVGVAYGSDVALVKKILLDCANQHPKVLQAPPPDVWFDNFGESSLDFSLWFWSNDNFYVEKIKSDLRFAIEAAFRINGVQIPFPQRDLHVIHVPPELRN